MASQPSSASKWSLTEWRDHSLDIRSEEQIQRAVNQAVETFGGIDVLINNASAISLTGTLATPLKRFDLMHQVNARGTFACSQACIPHLLKAENPRIRTAGWQVCRQTEITEPMYGCGDPAGRICRCSGLGAAGEQ